MNFWVPLALACAFVKGIAGYSNFDCIGADFFFGVLIMDFDISLFLMENSMFKLFKSKYFQPSAISVFNSSSLLTELQ